MALCDRFKRCLDVGEGFDAVDLCGFDQRRNSAPGAASFVMTGEECVFPVEGNWANQILDCVGVDLDATVSQEGLQPVPMTVDVAELFT